MATVNAFIRSTKNISNIRFRIRDGRATQLFYKGSKKIETVLFDAKKEQVKARALINNSLRAEINNYIITTKEKLLNIYLNFKPETSEELSALMNKEEQPKETVVSLLDIFNKKTAAFDIEEGTKRTFTLARHKLELYSDETGFQWDINKVTATDIKDFEVWLLNKSYSKNYVSTIIKKVRSVCNFARRYEFTTNEPFRNYNPIQPVFGTPIYLTIEERDSIYHKDLSETPYLAAQRDIFIFQCHTGCRVGNLLKLKKNNIVGDFLEYIPAKTINEKANVVRVPLTATAKEILKRYDDVSSERLLPFVSSQNYNEAIKDILEICGINRVVTVLNPKTRKEEKAELHTIASSHLARRTFCGNLYKKVKDPNLIGSMTGHSPGSRAFERYRSIDDDIKRETINLIE